VTGSKPTTKVGLHTIPIVLVLRVTHGRHV
jgi:hypothetical protein